MRTPPPLHDGATVAVVSPAGPVVPDILQPGLLTLRHWGLQLQVDDDVYDDHPTRGYLAGPDEQRTDAVQRALDDPDVDALVFSRGGYGTMRILPELDFEGFRRQPKLLVGFSDLTALHLHVAGNLGIPTLHAPVVKSLRMHRQGEPSFEALRDALFGRRDPPFGVDGLTGIHGNRATGPLLGGNLTLLVHSLASAYTPDLSEAILLLEDVGEEDYRLDRMFTALRLAEPARRPAGLVLGEFSECAGAYVDQEAIAGFVAELAAELEIPAVTGFPVGHEERNLAVPMGTPVTIDADAGSVEFHADATSEV